MLAPSAVTNFLPAGDAANIVYVAAFWTASSGSNKAELQNAINMLNSVLNQDDARFQTAIVLAEQVS